MQSDVQSSAEHGVAHWPVGHAMKRGQYRRSGRIPGDGSGEFKFLLSAADKAGTVPCRSDNWRFFTNHAHVLACLADDPEARLREIADRVGVTERAAHDLIGDLERSGYVRIHRVGRRNHYEVFGARPTDGLARPPWLGKLVGLLFAELEGSLQPGSAAGAEA